MKNFADIPPVWLVLFMAVIYVQTGFWNPLGFDASSTMPLGWGLIVAGLVLSGWAALHFWRHKTSIIPRNTARKMILGGPYRFSRNPIYLADAGMLLGFALVMGSTIGLLSVPLFMWVIVRRFIRSEEAGLVREFPDEFADFCSKTRRWI